MAHQVETMAYAGEVPWHGLGVEVSNDLTPNQMMKKAGLDWTVEQIDSYATLPNGKKVATGIVSAGLELSISKWSFEFDSCAKLSLSNGPTNVLWKAI